jgi:hypothetical protein
MAPLTLAQMDRIVNTVPKHVTQEELWDAGCRAMKAFNRNGPLGTGGNTAPSSARPAATPNRARVRKNNSPQSSAPPAFDDNFVPEPPAWLFD